VLKKGNSTAVDFPFFYGIVFLVAVVLLSKRTFGPAVHYNPRPFAKARDFYFHQGY
jgi:hypothetical protein